MKHPALSTVCTTPIPCGHCDACRAVDAWTDTAHDDQAERRTVAA